MPIDRRKQIIEAAGKSFSLFGYKATTMDQVAKLANVGKGTIYTFFSNKEELFDEIMSSLILELKQIADTEIDCEKPFFDNLHRVLYQILEFRKQHELMIRLSHEINELGTPAAKEGIRKVEKAILSIISKKVQESVNKGELKPCDPEITAFIILKMYLAFVYDWEKSHTPLDKEEIARLFHLYLAKGLAAK